jgi:RNA ligase (TIGR02306 family)
VSSSNLVPVATIERLVPHVNSDNLELAQVLGWQVVVPKGQFRVGQKVVYFPPDSVLPRELSDQFGVTGYLSKQRVRCTRLRGEPSFGFIVPVTDSWEIGANVAEQYGVTKWEPPPPPVRTPRMRTGGLQHPDALPESELFPRYTAIENMRHFPSVLHRGEPVIVTEKIHGCSSRVGIVDGRWMVGSHNVRRMLPENFDEVNFEGEHRYWYPLTLDSVRALLTGLAYVGGHRQVVLYGEIYGASIQTLSYGHEGSDLGYRAFDLLVDGKFLCYEDFLQTCKSYDVRTVPVLGYMPFSLDTIAEMSEGPTTLLPTSQAHIREGVVVRPVVERTDPRIGRVILKYVSNSYLLNRNISDYAEL